MRISVELLVRLVVGIFLSAFGYTVPASEGEGILPGPGTEPVYVVIMNHVEGDRACPDPAYDPQCYTSDSYQTVPLPPPGKKAEPSYSVDVAGNDLIYQILLNHSDTFGQKPKLFIEPAGEWWQTYADPVYGGKAFDRYDYLALGNEFGIQGHGIFYSGNAFEWYESPHTEQGVQAKFRDLHAFAEQSYYNGRKVNHGKTYTGGWKLEKNELGDAYTEYVIDHTAYALGYRISFEDHDGHIQNEPMGIGNKQPSPYVYRATYDDGVAIIKIDMNGGVNGQCDGNTPRCETPDEAKARFHRTLQARASDPDRKHVYYFGFATHSNGVWNDHNLAAGGYPFTGEGFGLIEIMTYIQELVHHGATVRFVTPVELAAIFEANNPSLSAMSPFGFHPAGVFKAGYTNNGYDDAQNIGVKWTRQGVYAYWFLIQPDLEKQEYDFSLYDRQWGDVPAGMNILANIAPQGKTDEGYCVPGSYLPVDINKYTDFVKATVERYDGDGIADMPGLANPIKYWQVGNEPSALWATGFAGLQRITYVAIKEACPACNVLIGGVAGMPPLDDYLWNFEERYRPILQELGGKYVDIMDFHWYGNATGDYKGAKDAHDHIRSVLEAEGFPPIPIWITEMGAYSGDPVPVPISNPPVDYSFQTERQQAFDYLKRFVYPLSFGAKKIFPAFGLVEGFKYDGGYFDYTGLIYDGWGDDDPGLGVKKLGYYTYKLMTEKLEGSDWDNIEKIQKSDNVYIYKFTRDGRPVWVAWWDSFDDTGSSKKITVDVGDVSSVTITEAVPNAGSGAELNEADYPNFFNSKTKTISNGKVTFTLSDLPVFLESQ